MDRATSVIAGLEQEKGYYTLDDVEKALRIETNPQNHNVFPFWKEIISEFKLAGRTGNARIHAESLKSVNKFNNNRQLTFQHITPEFLEKYEAWLR
jgi:hypothetical protein